MDMVVRALLGVGYYRSQSAPDLVLYLGERCYAGYKTMWCQVGMRLDGRPYIDHGEAQFDGSLEVPIRESMKGKPSTREAHVRGARLLREVWGHLGCPARGFAKSHVMSESHGEFVRSHIDNWRKTPGKGKCVTVPIFEHNALTRAVAEGLHALHTLTDTDRQSILTYLEGWQMDSHQIAAVLGCSHKTIYAWRNRTPQANGSTGDADVDHIVDLAMGLSPTQRQALSRRLHGR